MNSSPTYLVGFSTTIYKRVIKKIYDNDKGLEVIEALHHNPALAVPIVLKRLKQKDEEWKRAQREWNKVWREIDYKNFSKALDHQGINFKVSDRKVVVQKYLINEIEILHHEQREKKSNLANRYQFDFSFKNRDIFKHTNQLLLNYVETSATISSGEEQKVRAILADFVAKMLLYDNDAAEIEGFAMDIDASEPQDLADGKKMDIDAPAESEKQLVKKRTSHSLYANNTLYVFFRLYQVICLYSIVLISRCCILD